MNINYQAILDEKLRKIEKLEYVPTLLIHACCAPCSSYVLEYLSNYFKITILYYNPNIYPSREFTKRSLELKNFINKNNYKNEVKFVNTEYNSEEFYKAIKGLESEPEGGKRCYECYKLRMEYAAKYALDNNFDYFTTTLSISPYKNASWLNEIGEVLEKEYNIKYLYADFKKKNGYKRSIELSREFNLYRQDYCGCVYSKIERENYMKKTQE